MISANRRKCRMEWHSSLPIESVITAQGLDKNWPRLVRQSAPRVRKERRHFEEQTEERGDEYLSADEQGQEQPKKETIRDGTTRDHPEGFEILV
jgi:hypothetical protein